MMNKSSWVPSLLLIAASVTGCFEGIDPDAAGTAEGASTGTDEAALDDVSPMDVDAAYTLPPADDEIVEYLRTTNDITVEEARSRARLQEQAPLVLARATEEFGDDFAGSWLDADGTLKVAFVNEGETRGSALRSDFPESWRIRGVTARYSLQELSTLQDDIRAFTEADETLRAAFRGSRIDNATNRVVIGVAPEALSTVEDILIAEFGDMVSVEVQEAVPRTTACTTRESCGAPLRAGISIGGCTAAFTAQSADGTRWLMTAGHCVKLNDQITHGQQYIGPVRQSVYAQGVDAARIRVDNPYWLGGWVGGLVLSHSGDMAARVISALGNKHIPQNMIICKAGRMTHRTCGPVISTNWSGNFPGNVYFTNTVLARFCTIPGDSGSPVYFDGGAFDGKVKAIGIVSANGGTATDCLTWTSTLEQIYKLMPVRAIVRP